MPAALPSARRPPRPDDLDNYGIDDLSDDPFRSPSPSRQQQNPSPSDPEPSRKRKDGLGLDEQVSVQKRARAGGLRLKGRGHEFSDAGRLLALYQLWLDDLFPKARFLDALAMVERAGHKKRVMAARNAWIAEGRPGGGPADDDDADVDEPAARDSKDITNDTHQAASTDPRAAPRTPPPPTRDVPDDDDLYDGTPLARPAPRPTTEAEPEADDLDALMAEAEEADRGSGGGERVPPDRPSAVLGETGFEDDEAALAEMEGL
ncbi:hypothetical protein CDD83_7173 [Cordyceps sp. RAO-2017]|nr:hypothetical protein CDD83_7173 [Cordyceps sp. RAO-2017]